MRVRHLGFFSDLPHGISSEPRVQSLIADSPLNDESRLVKYLNDGELFIASPGVVHDVLSDSDTVIGSADILTDGVWAWPRDLSYYVSRYHVHLPEDFVEHARRNRWVIPNGIQLEALIFEL